MAKLAQFEDHFGKAIRSRWSPYPGKEALVMMNDTLTSVTGVHRALSVSCNTCVVTLLQDLGRIYFAQKEADAALEQEAKELDAMAEAVEAPKQKRTRKNKKA